MIEDLVLMYSRDGKQYRYHFGTIVNLKNNLQALELNHTEEEILELKQLIQVFLNKTKYE